MQNTETRLENTCQVLQEDIFRYFGRLSEVEQLFKKKSSDSSQRVRFLEAQMRKEEEREAQLNNEWVPVSAARQQSLRKIYENLMGANTVCQRFEQQLSQPQQPTEERAQERVTAIYDKVLEEHLLTREKK